MELASLHVSREREGFSFKSTISDYASSVTQDIEVVVRRRRFIDCL